MTEYEYAMLDKYRTPHDAPLAQDARDMLDRLVKQHFLMKTHKGRYVLTETGRQKLKRKKRADEGKPVIGAD